MTPTITHATKQQMQPSEKSNMQTNTPHAAKCGNPCEETHVRPDSRKSCRKGNKITRQKMKRSVCSFCCFTLTVLSVTWPAGLVRAPTHYGLINVCVRRLSGLCLLLVLLVAHLLCLCHLNILHKIKFGHQ